MSFPSLQLTDAGRKIIVNALAGGSIVFTSIGAGNGAKPSDINTLTALVNPVRTIGIGEITIGEGCANLTAILDNANLEAGFWWREIGIFAKDSTGDEVLYAYANAEEYADYIPAYSSTSYLRTTMNITVVVGDAESVSAIINEYIGYVTTETFEKHTSDVNNPHKVTKEQIGLGEVPNVTTNNQTPTFESTEDDLTTIESGETLKVIFGKVKKAITQLIGHISGDNPHGITLDKLKAAARDHEHSVSDITSGTLPVTRGGTGVTTYADLTNNLFEFGFYTGDGTGVRTIELGFTPKAVLLFDNQYGYTHDDDGVYGGLTLTGRNVIAPDADLTFLDEWSDYVCALGIVDNGFKVNLYPNYKIYTNDSSHRYYYIAFR